MNNSIAFLKRLDGRVHRESKCTDPQNRNYGHISNLSTERKVKGSELELMLHICAENDLFINPTPWMNFGLSAGFEVYLPRQKPEKLLMFSDGQISSEQWDKVWEYINSKKNKDALKAYGFEEVKSPLSYKY